MKYDDDVEEKITLLCNTFEELSNNPLYTKAGRLAYAASRIQVMQVFYGDKEEETD